LDMGVSFSRKVRRERVKFANVGKGGGKGGGGELGDRDPFLGPVREKKAIMSYLLKASG